MIGYVTLGTRDLKKAAAFCDKIAAEMGIGRFMESDTFIAWGSPDGGAALGLTKPFDGKPMTVGNGVMVALAAKDKAEASTSSRCRWAAPTKALRGHAATVDSMRPISGTRRATSSTPS
jgi:hypothetical protein